MTGNKHGSYAILTNYVLHCLKNLYINKEHYNHFKHKLCIAY